MKTFLSLSLSLSLSLPSFCFSQQTDTTTYSIVSAGLIKGFNKSWKNTDGTISTWYQFNDRGRGDSLRTVYRETEEGFPTFIHAAGVDYFKNPVFEEFSLVNNVAIWKNPVEEESQDIQGKAFYIGLKCNVGHLSKALHENGNKLKLLPYGELEMKALETHDIKNGPNSITLTLVEIKGSSFTPSYTWVDNDYVEFASVNDWMSSIRKGYEASINELLEAQKKYELNYFSQLATTLPQPLEDWMLIRNVNVFNAKEAVMQYGQDILIEHGNIAAVVPANSIVPSGGKIIDGTGKTALPGLWDMHTHTSDIMDGILDMACGVTHIRDMGNSEQILVKQKQFMSGKLIGPRIEVLSGLIDGAGPMAAPTGALINTLDEGLQMVRDFAHKGYQQIKLYSSIKPEWVKPMADEAHKNNMRVCGHIPAYMTATEAIADGYDEVTHMNMLALNFFGDTIDTRTPLRFSIPAQRTAGLDLHGKDFQDFIQFLKIEDIAVDPTLNVFEELFMAKDKVVTPAFAWSVDHFPVSVKRSLKAGGGGLPVPPGMETTYQKSFEAFQHILLALYNNGIRILPGTDAFAGFYLFRELELYVQSGIPAEKVLQMATWNTAVYTGKQNEFGNIEPGKKADLILVEGDPVQEITNIRNTRIVIANNKIYESNALFQLISISPF